MMRQPWHIKCYIVVNVDKYVYSCPVRFSEKLKAPTLLADLTLFLRNRVLFLIVVSVASFHALTALGANLAFHTVCRQLYSTNLQVLYYKDVG